MAGKEHEAPLNDITYIRCKEIMLDTELREGEVRDVAMHDGRYRPENLEKHHNPTAVLSTACARRSERNNGC